jgi:hypothetical protein
LFFGDSPMTLQLTLPPELEDRLRREADRQGLPADAVTLKILDENLPPVNQTAALPALFEQWRNEDESSPATDPDYDFFQALDAARTSNRKLFPPELKGISW